MARRGSPATIAHIPVVVLVAQNEDKLNQMLNGADAPLAHHGTSIDQTLTHWGLTMADLIVRHDGRLGAEAGE